MNKPLSITLDTYFPTFLVYAGIPGLFAGVAALFGGLHIAGIFIVIISLVLTTTRRGTTIDTTGKTIMEYTRVVGLTFGSRNTYHQLEKISLKSREMTQRMNSRGSSSTIRYTEYNAYLITDKDSILLMSARKQKKIERIMKATSHKLQIPFESL